jgi:hypothetical protein
MALEPSTSYLGYTTRYPRRSFKSMAQTPRWGTEWVRNLLPTLRNSSTSAGSIIFSTPIHQMPFLALPRI